MGKDDFIMPLKYRRRFARWSGKKCKAVLLAMFDYKETRTVNIADEYYDAFDAIRDDMDIIEEAYERRCKENAINGAKGGRAKKANATERYRTLQEKANATENSERGRTGAKLADKIREDNIKEKYNKKKSGRKVASYMERQAVNDNGFGKEYIREC